MIASSIPRMPHHAVMLGVDPGASSGWAVMFMGQLRAFGSVREERSDSHVQRDAAVAAALLEASAQVSPRSPVPVIVAVEKFGAGGGRHGFFGPRTVAGVERRVGAWIDSVVRAGIARSRIVRVLPQVWRSAVLGKGSGPHEEMAQLTASYVQTRFDMAEVPNEDVCAAIGIACWMGRAAEVHEAMPRRK